MASSIEPSPAASAGLLGAFGEIARRIERSLGERPEGAPVRMFVAGGTAVHFYTGARPTQHVDAVFSHRLLLPDDLDVVYVDEAGQTRLVYFDRQYNDSFGLLHEDANHESVPVDRHDAALEARRQAVLKDRPDHRPRPRRPA
jgi:hypothetical protein